MRKSVVIGIAVFVVAAFVATYLLLFHGEAPAPPRLAGEAEPRADHAAAARATPVAEPAESRRIDQIRPTAFVEPELAAATRAAAPDDLLRVLVVDESTGLPVPEAEVAWTDGRLDVESARGIYASPSSVVASFDQAPQRTLADTRGIAVIRTCERLVVAARSGALFGSRRFQKPPRGEIRVPIQPGLFIAARVVTSSGEPVVGMPVRIDVSRSRGKSSQETRTISALSRAPDGIAVAEHLPATPDDANQSVTVSAMLEGSPQREAVKAPLEKLKEGPLTLVVGPMGRVAVKLQDAEGKPFFGEAKVSLWVARSSKGQQSELRAIPTGGTASFPWVPVGAGLSVSAEAEGFDSVQGQKAGPLSTTGEELTVEVRLGRRRALIVGRAVDESGAPISGTTLQAEFLGSNRTLLLPTAASVTTDGLGGFKLALDRQLVRDGVCDLELEVRSSLDQLDRHGFITLPKISDSDETAIGDVKLARPEPLASGVVEDELGAPVAGALVITENARGPPARGMTITPGRRNVAPTDQMRTRTNEAGAFQIPLPLRPRSRPASFGLRADLDGYLCTEPLSDLKPGATALKIVVRGTGVIQGRLLLPDRPPVRKLEIHVRRPTDGPAPAVQRFADCVDSDGAFRLPGILPGAVTVVIRRVPSADLAEIGDVAVPRLAATEDSRLRPFDLREHPVLRP